MSRNLVFILILRPTVYRLKLDRDKHAGVFPGKMYSDCRKNHGCRQTKPECTSRSIFGVGNAAKCCKFKRYANRVRSTKHNDELKDDSSKANFVTKTFRLSSKGTFFCPYIDIRYFSQVSTSTLSNNRFAALVARISRQEKMTFSFPSRVALRLPSSPPPQNPYGRAYVRAHAAVTTKFSHIDRLPNSLTNGAPLYSL